MVGWLSKNVRHYGLLTAKKFKITLAKMLQKSTKKKKKRNLDQKINDSKPLISSCLSINFTFSGRVSKPTITSNKDHSFYNTVLLKNFILQTSPRSTL